MPSPAVPLCRVVVSGTGSFLPGEPVRTDQIDAVLGPLDDAPPKVQQFVRRMVPRMTEQMGIECRHFAVDPRTGQTTHTVASLAAEAASRALAAAGRQPAEVDLLLVSTPIADQCTPPTSVFLQEQLGIGPCAEMEIHSNCSGVGKCMQIAEDALARRRYRTALVVYSQLSSVYLRGRFFNQPKMTRTQAALRYILADGSGAVVLEGREPSDDQPLPGELLGTYIESIGWDRPPAMTGGAGLKDLGQYYNFGDIFAAGAHHLDQDLAVVGQQAAAELLAGIKRSVAAMGLLPQEIDWLVVSVPNRSMFDANLHEFTEFLPRCAATAEFPCTSMGYTGGAAILIEFDRLVRAGKLRTGDTLLAQSVESSKWMSGGFAVRW